MRGQVSAGRQVSLFSTLAVQAALEQRLLREFTEETGIGVQPDFDPTSVLLERIHSGEVPDVLIAVTDDIRQLSAQGTVDGRARLPVARTGIGLAVRARTPRPLIATVDDLVRTLLGARSVAYSRTGASGIYFAQLLGRLGIAEAVNARATIVQKGFAAATLLDGRADLAVQQVSELMTVPGVDVVGPFPADAAHDTEFSIAPSTAAAEWSPASELVCFLGSERARTAYGAFGLKAPLSTES